MKATDFKREHFTNGREFTQQDFDAYIAASENLSRTVSTRYLPCVLGGVLLSLVFSQGIGGFIGNILAIVCIFAGLLIGGGLNLRASREVRAKAERLGITRQDVAAAKRHVQEGTLAWTGDVEAVEASAPAEVEKTSVTDANRADGLAVDAASTGRWREAVPER